jgi:hypothetical protein
MSSSTTLRRQIKGTLQSIKSLGGFLEIQISFKTSFSSKEALSKVIKPPSSTLEVYKERSSVGSSLNAP